MKTITKAALVAATILATSPAQAVSYIRYDVATVGSGTFIGYDGLNSTTAGFYFNPFTTFNFSYVIALNSPRTSLNLTNSSISYSAPEASYFYPFGGGSTLNVDATTISFNEVLPPQSDIFGEGLRASACLSNSRINQFPTGAVAIEPACGSVTFRQQFGRLSNISYTGTIASITGTAFEGGDVVAGYGNVGLIATFVPEPTSWLLMIAGFGMVGATMRYRRRSKRVAFT